MQRNLPRLYAFAFLKMTLFPMAVITLYWKEQLGLSLSEIMLLQGGFAVATALCEYPSGLLADRFGYRASLTLATVLGIAGWSLYTVATDFWSVLCAEAVLGVSFAFISGSDEALLFETLRAVGAEKRYHACDGRMTAIAQAGEACGALFAGLLYARWPLFPFLLQIVVWLVALYVCRGMVEAPSETRLHPHLSSAAAGIREAAAVWRHPRLRTLILLSTFFGLASFYPVWLIQPYMQTSGVPIAWFGPIWAGANLTVALASWLSARICTALGTGGALILFCLLIAAAYLGLGLSGGLFSFFFYYLLTTMRGLQGPLLRHHLQQKSRRDNRAGLLSLKSFAFRSAFLVSGPLLGVFADHRGLQAAFLWTGALLLLALIPLSGRFAASPPED